MYHDPLGNAFVSTVVGGIFGNGRRPWSRSALDLGRGGAYTLILPRAPGWP